MSTRFDTTPTVADLASARATVAAVAAGEDTATGTDGVAAVVAMELGLIVARLAARTSADARFAAEARALYTAWLEA